MNRTDNPSPKLKKKLSKCTKILLERTKIDIIRPKNHHSDKKMLLSDIETQKKELQTKFFSQIKSQSEAHLTN